MAPSVSVLMTVRDGGPFLEEAVRSVLRQTHRDLELVIVDDGSTDGSPALLRRLAEEDARIRLFTVPGGRGIPTASNEGLRHCRGLWIARFDADDVCRSDRIERQVARMEADPGLVLLGSRVTVVDAEGRTVPADTLLPLTHDDIDRSLLAGEWPLMHTTVMMPAAAVRGAGGYDETYPRCSDHDLFLRLAERGRVANLADTLVSYRVHLDAVTTQFRHGHGFKERAIRTACGRRGLAFPPTIKGAGGFRVNSAAVLFRPSRLITALLARPASVTRYVLARLASTFRTGR